MNLSKRWRPVPVMIVLFTLITTALASLSALTSDFTDHSLAPLFMARAGLKVYTDPNAGPMLSTLYPPLSLWLYAPVTLFANPATVMVAAGILAQAFFLTPVFLLLRESGRATAGLAIAMAIFVGWSAFDPVLINIRLVHADAPAIFLSGLALFATVRYFSSGRLGWVFAAAVAASLAPWAKQTAVPIVAAPALVFFAGKRRNPLAWYCASVLLLEGGLSSIFSMLYGFSNLWLWLLALPSRQPWIAVWSTALPVANQQLLRENAPALIVIFTVLWIRRRQLHARIGHVWAVCLVAGLLFWPTSILGLVKVGGGLNTLLYSTFFITIAALALMRESIAARQPDWVRATAAFALIIVSVPSLIDIARTVIAPRRAVVSQSVTAYRYMKLHPGEIYFPWHPLAGYLAEHRWYHFELGISDRIAAGVSIDPANFRHYLPTPMRYVAFSGTVPQAVLELLPEFTRRVEIPELPGWIVLAKAEQDPQ